MIDKINEYRKAVAALLVPALLTLAPAVADGVVTVEEWIWVVVAALGTSSAVAMIPNGERTYSE